MARISDLHRKWMKEPKYRKAYKALEEEFVLASTVVGLLISFEPRGAKTPTGHF